MAYTDIQFQTDQSGANINICSTQSQIFNFSLTNTYNAKEADIVLKKGSGTTASVIATIYNQPNGGGSVVASSTVLAANVSQSYASVVFTFNTILSPNVPYSLVISSSSSCSGNSPYSMKGGNFQVYNADTNNILNTGYGISSNINSASTFTANLSVSTPEPPPTPQPFTVKLYINKIGYKNNQPVVQVINGV